MLSCFVFYLYCSVVNLGGILLQMVNSGENINLKFKQLFLGEYEPNLTKGNRLALPKKIREATTPDKSVVLTRGFDGCISGYTKKFWEAESVKTLSSGVDDKRNRLLKRFMFSGAFEVEYDDQGRIILPKNLAENASIDIDSSIVLVGAGDHFEIWNKENWKKSLLEAEKELL